MLRDPVSGWSVKMLKCGYRTGVIYDPARLNWTGSGNRPVAWSAWYPAGDGKSRALPSKPVFDLGDVFWQAPLVKGGKFPVVLLSHGTGGTAESLGWLARALALQGHIVLGANHHGNTGLEPYRAEGFLCWWERVADLTFLLSSLGTDDFFAGRLDLNRVTAIGFSLGGYTVIALAGARTSMEAFEDWLQANSITAKGPKEFPDAADHIPELRQKSSVFRESWARHSNDFTDRRITSVIAIAPAPPIRSFLPSTLSSLAMPVTILTGGADVEAPPEYCANWITSLNPRIQHHDLGPDIGHYTFLGLPDDKSQVGEMGVFTDRAGVDRCKLHEKAIGLVRKNLASGAAMTQP